MVRLHMKDKVQNLRRKYEGFRKGQEDILSVRSEALSVLEEAKRSGNNEKQFSTLQENLS